MALRTLARLLASLPILFGPALAAQTPLLVPNPHPNDYDQYGYDLDVDGGVAIIAAPGEANGFFPGGVPNRSGAAYIYRIQPGGTWALEAELRPSDPDPGDYYAYRAAVSGDVAVVSAWREVEGGPFGAVYVYRHAGGVWTQEARLTGTAASEFYFGVDIDVQDDRLVVGARDRFAGPPTGGGGGGGAFAPVRPTAEVPSVGPDACVPAPAYDNARAFVYEFAGGAWALADTLVFPEEIVGSGFGQSVSLDDDVVVVGAPLWYDHVICTGNDTDGDGAVDGTERGRAYVYRRGTTGLWALEATLQPQTSRDRDQFGHSVAVSGDLLIAGAPYRDGVAVRSGAAYGYRFDGATWAEEQEFVGQDTDSGDYFGFAVDLMSDYAVIGAPYYLNGTFNIGATYGFQRSAGSWQQGLQVTYDVDTSPSVPFATSFAFGTSVALDDAHVLIGAPDDPRFGGPLEVGDRIGTAYAYTLADYFGLVVAGEPGPGATNPTLTLEPALPNPTSASASLALTLTAPANVRVALYDVLGREVAVVCQGARGAGRHLLRIDTAVLPAGTYAVRATDGAATATSRLTVAR